MSIFHLKTCCVCIRTNYTCGRTYRVPKAVNRLATFFVILTEQQLHILHRHAPRKASLFKTKCLNSKKRFIRLCRKFDCTQLLLVTGACGSKADNSAGDAAAATTPAQAAADEKVRFDFSNNRFAFEGEKRMSVCANHCDKN